MHCVCHERDASIVHLHNLYFASITAKVRKFKVPDIATLGYVFEFPMRRQSCPVRSNSVQQGNASRVDTMIGAFTSRILILLFRSYKILFEFSSP